MRDLLDILAAAADLKTRNESATLATVVSVKGSSYRLPGARMLVDPTGRRLGSVSGGCLEADIARRGRLLTADHPTALVTYDNTDPDAIWNLGCNGTIKILIERLSPGPAAAAVDFLRNRVEQRTPGVIATLFNAPTPNRLMLTASRHRIQHYPGRRSFHRRPMRRQKMPARRRNRHDHLRNRPRPRHRPDRIHPPSITADYFRRRPRRRPPGKIRQIPRLARDCLRSPPKLRPPRSFSPG